MSSTQASAAENRARLSASRRLAIAIALLAATGDAGAARAAGPGKIYFFATREACAASGAFTLRECAAAFQNARLQLRDRAPRFASASECQLKFRLCEAIRAEAREGDAMAYAPDDAAPVYTPMALGVEMIGSAKGAEAAPTLAIDMRARIFPYFPVARPYEARRDEPARLGEAQENPAILSADRFEPFPKRKLGSVTTFTASALGAIEGATRDSDAMETPEQRRARLKAAPFVE